MLNRTECYGMKKQVFHEQVHGPDNIDCFVSPKNVDSRPSDENLKIHTRPGHAEAG